MYQGANSEKEICISSKTPKKNHSDKSNMRFGTRSNEIVGGGILILTIGAIVVILVLSQRTEQNIRHDEGGRKDALRTRILAVFASGAIAWPLLWLLVVGKRNLTKHPFIIAGLIWPLVMTALDMNLLVHGEHPRSGTSDKFHIEGLKSSGGGIVSISFALGSLLVAQMDREASNAASPILMFALLLCMAFVVPETALSPRSFTAQTTEAVQKVFVNYSTGLVITGVTLALGFVSKKKD